MSIASGFTKMKNYILTSSGYKLLSRWTSSQTVHMGDGTDDTDTVEYRFGAMKGVTSSLATDNDEFALSASAGKNLQDQCTQLNQSLTNLKNPAKGTKGILVNGGSPLSRDFLLVYTLKTTNKANTGASFSINGIKVADLTTRTPNNIIEICGCVRAFKGDIITTHVASAGGYADVYAYTPNTI